MRSSGGGVIHLYEGSWYWNWWSNTGAVWSLRPSWVSMPGSTWDRNWSCNTRVVQQVKLYPALTPSWNRYWYWRHRCIVSSRAVVLCTLSCRGHWNWRSNAGAASKVEYAWVPMTSSTWYPTWECICTAQQVGHGQVCPSSWSRC